MMTRRGLLVGLALTPLGGAMAAKLAVIPAVNEWMSFTEAGVPMEAVRRGDVVTGSDGRQWRVGMMPSGRVGLRSV